MPELKRSIHNTGSRNYVKLDYQDLSYCLDWAESLNDLTEDEQVTVERIKIVREFQKQKYEEIQRSKRNDSRIQKT